VVSGEKSRKIVIKSFIFVPWSNQLNNEDITVPIVIPITIKVNALFVIAIVYLARHIAAPAANLLQLAYF
jgi:hypothetical protein